MPRKTLAQLAADPITADLVTADPIGTAAQVIEAVTLPATRARTRRKGAAPTSVTVAEVDTATTEGDVATSPAQPRADNASSLAPDDELPAATVDAAVKPPFVPADGMVTITPKPGTKQALVVGLLSRAEGATVAELQAATGWLPHTTRAALTGLRKRGHVLAGSKVDGVNRYRILPGGADAATDRAGVGE